MHSGMVTFSVRGKGFASVTREGRMQPYVPQEQTDAAQAAHRPVSASCAGARLPVSACRSPTSTARA
ncbi:hypothetical protein [Streptomyces sp. DG1A-41]|uniref:hypothetical protein n=1 Tax=Streptomyces sp. DG1A-41 TaxID=3125779 RepID=UPI0030D6026B